MLKAAAHRIVSHPFVYDALQWLVSVRHVHQRLSSHIALLANPKAVILDVGGGTGLTRSLWPATNSYICLDIDIIKLHGLLDKYPGTAALLSDGTQMAIQSNSVDFVTCIFVAHHIPDELLQQFMAESARVLGRNGKLILIDPLWAPNRLMGRLLWNYDRGSYPRSFDTLQRIIQAHYVITHCDRFAVYHEYGLFVASKKEGL